jgi:transposase
MIQLAWRFLRFQKDSVLAQWFRARAVDGRSGTRKTMIVALARKPEAAHRALAHGDDG